MLAEDIMTTDVVSVSEEASLRETVVTMLRDDVGSVIVEREGTPTGICTKTDALIVAAKTDQPLSDYPTSAAMTEDLVTGTPDTTVRKIVHLMNKHGVTKLPITRDFEVVGIVTMSDITRHHTSLIQEAHRVEDGRTRWSED